MPIDYAAADAYAASADPQKTGAPTTSADGTEYTRPAFAPNGQPWPKFASYLPGEARLDGDGLCKVTVDNRQNDSDVLVKLFDISDGSSHSVRTFYIPARGEFAAEDVGPGRYDIRYRNLTSGQLTRSEPFDLEEKKVEDGTEYSEFTVTLYKVANGNMQTYDLAESEF